MRDDVVLESVSCDDDRWLASASFRDKRHSMAFKCNYAGRLRPLLPSPLALTTEGQEIYAIVDRIRKGAAVEFPLVVTPSTFSTYPSAREIDWELSLREVWVDHVECSDELQWLAHLRLDGVSDVYELKIMPGPLYQSLKEPLLPLFSSYEYDLMRLLVRISHGERFALPLQLRARWPAPPDFPALP